ncbi:MAG TPA: DNA-binding response regulator [Bacteroides sp.]|nr:response regulator transcription factor [Phocaeicola coprophilus]HBB06891.1 DNA-binding response regulator [Bacteroides sp.]
MKLLIIEDEKELSGNIAAYMSSENYVCEQAFSYDEALTKVCLYDYDCVLLDLMLPGGNGLDILRAIREKKNPVGVIIVSAKDSVDDKVKGLEIGADDYLAKPFHLPELSMRIYAIIRRKMFAVNNLLSSNRVTIDLLSKSVTANGQPVVLTRTEYELLLFFISNRNKVVSKGSMAEHLSGDMADMLENHDFVYTHIKNLKAKLAEAGVKDCIKNVYGTGYKWVEP